jgi:monofunctional biosynthetic peptidoglycan transglycosylase
LAAPSAAPPHAGFGQHARRALRAIGYAAGAYLVLVLSLIAVYRWVDPPVSTLMLYEGTLGAGAAHTWVPIEDISPNLVRAVLVAEDARFCDHWGVDLGAMREAIENSSSIYPRGGSTISMQVTKNLFLWQSRSYLRKLIELPLTLIMELAWPKARILEVYLNIAEWGPGIFGAEAAARHHFGKPASQLTEREAAQLAAALPNPRLRDAGDPGPKLLRKSGVVQRRLRAAGASTACLEAL